jgi:two-component system sensor histidine kinase and response regulator WspE
MLAITISDDGRGINPEAIKRKVLDMKLVREDMANSLTETEILDFLFLPGFSTASDVTDISGRGVGLNVVQTMIQEVAGSIRVTQAPNEGTTFHLQLPLTLSVIRALIVDIAEETYAFPLSRIDRSLTVRQSDIEVAENREYFNFHGENIGLVMASQVMEMKEMKHDADSLPVIVLSDRSNTYGLIVDRFIGERELVVQELDPRLGKIQDISAGALLEDGSPVLIMDVEDLVRSIDNLLSGGRLHQVEYGAKQKDSQSKKRVLVVDDSITVR